MSKIVIIGKSSLLARRFLTLATPKNVVAVSHRDIDTPGLFDDVACVVNFAFDPRMGREPYAVERDIDVVIAKRIHSSTRFVMLSTRMVYGAEQNRGAREDDQAIGLNQYGKNKVETEARLTDLLGGRLVILRIGNVLAWEPENSGGNFMLRLLESLRNHGCINYDISPFVRKDFVTERYLVDALDKACASNLGGKCNVGSGIPLEVGRVAMWVLEGYGQGNLMVSSPREVDEFWLDMTRSTELFGAPPGREDLRLACVELGKKIARD